MGYLHDLSVYVGKKFTDEGQLEDPKFICYGTIPQPILDEYTAYSEQVSNKFPTVIKPLQQSIKKSLQKYNRTRDQASKAAISVVKDLQPLIHPALKERIDQKESALMSFKCQLKNYKPKNSGLELGILKTKDERKISSFQDALRQQNLSKLAKDQRIQARKEYEAEIHKQEQILERNQIEMKAKEVENEKKLEECPKDSEVRMSKKRKQKMDKIQKDDSLTEAEKEALLEAMSITKRQKRSG